MFKVGEKNLKIFLKKCFLKEIVIFCDKIKFLYCNKKVKECRI